MNAATLLDVSDGRYTLGLGASTPALAEGFHDVEFAHPAARIERVVSEVANLVGGGRAALTRESDARPLRLGAPLPHEPEIMVAGMGPRMRQGSATLASGWLPAFFGRDLLPTYIAELRQIRADAGLDPDAFTVIVGPNMVVDPGTSAWSRLGGVEPRLVHRRDGDVLRRLSANARVRRRGRGGDRCEPPDRSLAAA